MLRLQHIIQESNIKKKKRDENPDIVTLLSVSFKTNPECYVCTLLFVTTLCCGWDLGCVFYTVHVLYPNPIAEISLQCVFSP